MTKLNWVTVTLNPAIDLTGQVEALSIGDVNHAHRLGSSPGGKGINVAKVLTDLGSRVTVTGFLGEENADIFKHYFNQNNLEDRFILVPGSTRTNIKLQDKAGATTDINFDGFSVSHEDIGRLESTLYELARSHDGFIFGGSLAKSLPESVVVEWITNLKALGKKVVLDSSKSMLKLGIEAKPWMIKPNEHEASELLGRKIYNVAQGIEAAQCLYKQGIANVLLSMGEKGLIWASDAGCHYVHPLDLTIVSTVGAGDSVVAGFCHASEELCESQIALAAACGSLAVQQVNVGIANVESVLSIKEQLAVEAIH
ncbi:1-phosphofructokinase [Vibrio sp. SCSIO 43136]|uniref:1-phosphofructokinase n=1 Tax=Vibrio sp. SCSIO 43136 TaxID=2819101 RepID=UPI0020755CDC|nr:1-phosphofructokinase [Vibrio sp. SCSIO 43136]USD67219.1 1-phosphofructokinase [Vibrio sp. SCSIO 43136]